MIATTSGLPIEFIITPGSVADITALRLMDLDLPWGDLVYAADRAYNYRYEDFSRSSGNLTNSAKKSLIEKTAFRASSLDALNGSRWV